ncbi:hypothetical protein DYBT9275_02057 [Dyadobacter sp. CECT 9275]|uniref:DUF3822 family protein n=1 Tax=Dyadobacter helix TaxID=2822344 RepID=A0A916N5K4_9BACT|nr:DUF3822 family protein [Dyadobacter sp. CECT 9275]CAG4998686.1 hypothetical protein DYBT9275_02057 [Dyadobacter sp. CECT 9275]
MAHSENQVIEIIPSLLAGDTSFDTEAIPFCTLCVEVDERRIRFCIVRDENMECVWLEDYGFDTVLSKDDVFDRLKKIFTGHLLWSSNSWKNVRISINSHAFSLIPTLVFDEKVIGSYLSFAMGNAVPADEKVLYHEVPLVHASNVFSIPVLWYEWMINHFGSSHITFYHITSPLIIGALVSHAEQQELRIASVYFEKDFFTLIITESEQLVLCNRFRFSQPSELAYIILFALSQLNFLAEEIKVLCYGEVSAGADTFEELSRFFPNLLIGNGPTTLKYNKHCGDIPGHRYFGLFNTYLVSS